MKSINPSLLSTSPSSLLPAGAYIYSIIPLHPAKAGSAASLAAIASDNSLRLFDCATLQPFDSVRLQHEGVTCLRRWGRAEADADHAGGADMLTAGRDGVVRGWDLRAGSGREQVLELAGDCRS